MARSLDLCIGFHLVGETFHHLRPNSLSPMDGQDTSDAQSASLLLSLDPVVWQLLVNNSRFECAAIVSKPFNCLPNRCRALLARTSSTSRLEQSNGPARRKPLSSMLRCSAAGRRARTLGTQQRIPQQEGVRATTSGLSTDQAMSGQARW